MLALLDKLITERQSSIMSKSSCQNHLVRDIACVQCDLADIRASVDVLLKSNGSNVDIELTTLSRRIDHLTHTYRNLDSFVNNRLLALEQRISLVESSTNNEEDDESEDRFKSGVIRTVRGETWYATTSDYIAASGSTGGAGGSSGGFVQVSHPLIVWNWKH